MNQLNTQFHHETSTGTTRISMQGKFCGMDAIHFKKDMLNYIAERGSEVTIDLKDLEALDLTGVNALAMINIKLKAMDSQFRILIPDGSPMLEVVRDTKLHRVLPIEYLNN